MTVLELQRRTIARLGDDPDGQVAQMHYTPTEVLAALNQAQRLFVLFTLCLETTANFALTGTARYHMLNTFGDWIVPLRIRNAVGKQVRPSRLADLAALDPQWSKQTGTPVRYTHTGFDLLQFYKHDSTTIPITYARSPIELLSAYPSNNAQTPEIPDRYQPALIDAAIPLLRTKEGQQEWKKVLPQWDRYLEAVDDLAVKIRARNKEQGYDTAPVELNRADWSRMLQRKAG